MTSVSVDDNISQQHFVLSSHLKNDKVTKILDKIIHLPEAISLDDCTNKHTPHSK